MEAKKKSTGSLRLNRNIKFPVLLTNPGNQSQIPVLKGVFTRGSQWQIFVCKFWRLDGRK